MKTTLLISALAALSFTLWTDYHPQVISAKSMTPASRLHSKKSSAHVRRAFAAINRNDLSQAVETRATLAALVPGDPLRGTFAELLERRGETRAAFELMRVHVHFGESSTPIDKEMALYARLADKVGQPQEAAWADGVGRPFPQLAALNGGRILPTRL